MYALRIGSSTEGWTEFPLMAPAARPELLKISPNGCLKEDERYQLRLVTDVEDAISGISVIVDGDEVARGLAGDRVGYRDESGTQLYVYAPAPISSPGADGQIFLLIYGFARIEVTLSFEDGKVVCLESDDIPVLVRGDRESETTRVEGMFDALFSAPPTRPLQWMLTGTPSYDERFTIVEGGTASPASRSVSTFLQVTARVLSEFERLLPSFRGHVRSSISEVPARVPGSKVRVAGAHEARWIASHPHLLKKSRLESGIKLGSGFYMPRYVQTEQRTRSYDTYENRTIVSFLSACGQRLGRLSALIDSEKGLSESVERALNPFSTEGYVLSSLLIASLSHRRGEATRERAEYLRRKAAALEHAYALASPGVEPKRFLPPRRSKVFQEVVPYTKLYEQMMHWCIMGDLSLQGSLLALRTARMDRFYEYYVLLSILTALDERGYAPSRSIEPSIEVVEYTLAQSSRFFRNERQVANKFTLDGSEGTVTLYYQPVIYGDDREENGIKLHRTSVGPNGFDSYYTPDFLLIFNGKHGTKTVVIDAKYRYTRAVMEDRSDGEFQKCLMKYRQEISGTDGPPDSVWLLCGRDTKVEILYWERSSWAQSEVGFIRSGAMTLTPTGDDLDSLLEMIGIRHPTDARKELPTNPNDQLKEFSPFLDHGNAKLSEEEGEVPVDDDGLLEGLAERAILEKEASSDYDQELSDESASTVEDEPVQSIMVTQDEQGSKEETSGSKDIMQPALNEKPSELDSARAIITEERKKEQTAPTPKKKGNSK